MWTSLAATSGTCSVAIDKQAAVSIDGFSAQPVCLIAWSAFGLGGGTHSVVVTNLGQSELASSKGQDNATLYQLDAFTWVIKSILRLFYPSSFIKDWTDDNFVCSITTTDSTSSGSTIGTSNSLYLLSILISLFVYPRVSWAVGQSLASYAIFFVLLGELLMTNFAGDTFGKRQDL